MRAARVALSLPQKALQLVVGVLGAVVWGAMVSPSGVA